MKAIIILLCVSFLAVTTAEYLPPPCMCAPGPTVCGSDYRNYDGECNLKCQAMHQGRQVYMIYNGPCEDLYRPDPNPYPSPNPYGTCDPCGIFSRYQPYNRYNPYDPYNPFGSSKNAEN